MLTGADIPPEAISTSLAHVAHALILASHYLAVRLPAEITLPHRDYPRPAIFPLDSSYCHGEAPFPGSTLSAQILSEAKDGETQHSSRPRPLFLDKALPTLERESPSAYKHFLEGVALLAYDIAWLCCSQGVSLGPQSSLEEVCSMGQNLWRLLIGEQLHRKSAEPAFPTSPNGSPKDSDAGDISKAKSQVGRWSHGTTHSFLAGAEGTTLTRGFKLPSPTRLADRLRRKLTNEAPMLEWEKIDNDEARTMGEEDDGVMVRGHRRGGSSPHLFGVESIATVATTIDTAAGTLALPRGSSGWTKIKSR